MSKIQRIAKYRKFLETTSNYEKLKGTEPNGLFFYPLEDILKWLDEVKVKLETSGKYTFSDKMMLNKFEKVYTNKL